MRFGVGLLGLRITLDQFTALGWQPVLMMVVTVALTIGIGAVLARAMGLRASFGVLTGGAVAICGAMAPLAISAAQPGRPLKEKAALFTVIGVSALSTLAMMLYPLITSSLHMNDVQAGIFIGGTIHDVAQVVGAGDTATLIKLLRVSMLLPIIAIVAWSRAARRQPRAMQIRAESERHCCRVSRWPSPFSWSSKARVGYPLAWSSSASRLRNGA